MLLAALTLVPAILIGYARGGRLERLSAAQLRLPWLLLLALAAQAGLLIVGRIGDVTEGLRQGLLIASLATTLLFVVANRTLPGMWVALLGFVPNASVIIANGAMPVSPDAIAYFGAEELIEPGKHQLLESGDPLGWLADIISVPGLRIIVSVGDLVLALGVAMLVERLMRGPIGRHAAPYGASPTTPA